MKAKPNIRLRRIGCCSECFSVAVPGYHNTLLSTYFAINDAVSDKYRTLITTHCVGPFILLLRPEANLVGEHCLVFPSTTTTSSCLYALTSP